MPAKFHPGGVSLRGVALLLFVTGAQQAAPLRALASPQQRDLAAGDAAHPDWPQQALRASKAMIVSDEELASQAGIEILKRGGNAVDAAVAVGFALAVVEPSAGNIGGGGFMLVRMADGRSAFVDYRETAPAHSARDMYLRADGSLDTEAATIGYRSVAIPATVAGMELALRTYGTMRLADVMAPAIRHAEQGFPIHEKLARSLRASRPLLQRFGVSRRVLLKNGDLFQAGDILRQPELAETLKRIARNGAAEFYRGQTARELAQEMARMGGLITLADLAGYQAKIREPLRAKFKADGSEWEVITSPPPSSGGTALIEALNILAPVELRGWDDAQTLHWVAEAMRRAFADRAAYLADSDFAKVPVRGLTDPRYAETLRATINPNHASSSAEIRAGDPIPFDSAATTRGHYSSGSAEQNRGGDSISAPAGHWSVNEALRSGHTTHYSVVDASGNAVSNTFTLNNSYGSGVMTSSGFLLNDTMDDFTTQPGVANKLFGLIQSDANAIAPGKRSLSSMTPTILLRDSKLSFVTGSPGGPRIISATLLSVLHWMRFGADAAAAVNAPRIHHQWMPDLLRVEETLPAALRARLEHLGHKLTGGSWIGQVEAIGIDPKTGERLGAADPRREGRAAGY